MDWRLDKISPVEFEKAVREQMQALGSKLTAFASEHLDRVQGVDGEYQIDVTARFEALGADFLVLIECKHQKRAVEREVLLALQGKVQATGAQKGMVFTTATFQKGALEFAKTHGIALVQVLDSGLKYITKTRDGRLPTGRPLFGVFCPERDSFRIMDHIGLQIMHEQIFGT